MNEDIIRIDSYDFDSRIETGVSLVLFYAEWCVHSRGLEPIIEEIADRYYDSIRVLALDIEQSPDVAARCGIDNTPTVIVFKDGKAAEYIRGANPPSVYADCIEDILSEA